MNRAALHAVQALLALASLATAATAQAATPAVGPVAVMPFKNLNQDPKLAWLSVGIAETMIADLRRGKEVPVVERDQLDRALAEIALQGSESGEVSTAVKAGKLAGARTMVLGSYQRAGQQLRITARFVLVETGLVQQTAKVTGHATKVFLLQDQIVARLLGKKLKKKAKPQRPRPEGESALKAYELYAMSLTASTRVERVKFLQASLKVDPQFTYAIEDLNALEKRIRRYDEEAERVQERRSEEMRQILDQQDLTPEQRSQQAWMLLAGHQQSFRYRALLADAREIQKLDLPAYAGMSVQEYAAFSEFQALQMLKQHDQALQVGERYLARYPGGTYYTGVKISMQALMGQIQRREQGRARAATEIERIEQERTELKALWERQDEQADAVRLRSLDFRRCAALGQNSQYQEAIKECRAFERNYSQNKDDVARDLVLNATWYRLLALMELGRFKEARALATRLSEEEPEWSRDRAMWSILSSMPKE